MRVLYRIADFVVRLLIIIPLLIALAIGVVMLLLADLLIIMMEGWE